MSAAVVTAKGYPSYFEAAARGSAQERERSFGSLIARGQALLFAEAASRSAIHEAMQLFSRALSYARGEGHLGTVYYNVGLAKLEEGRRAANLPLLQEATQALLFALKRRLPVQVAAGAQSALGSAYGLMGELCARPRFYAMAIACHRRTLAMVGVHEPLWAASQNNLGACWHKQGEQTGSPKHFEGALAAYRRALEVYRQEIAPARWAAVQNNIGSALTSLGQIQDGSRRWELAIAIFSAVLLVRTQQVDPYGYAETCYNQATAFRLLHARCGGVDRLLAASKTYKCAIQTWTHLLGPKHPWVAQAVQDQTKLHSLSYRSVLSLHP